LRFFPFRSNHRLQYRIELLRSKLVTGRKAHGEHDGRNVAKMSRRLHHALIDEIKPLK